MARKAHSGLSNSFPSKIYFIQTKEECFGPYSRKPTLALKREGGKLIEFKLLNNVKTIEYFTSKNA